VFLRLAFFPGILHPFFGVLHVFSGRLQLFCLLPFFEGLSRIFSEGWLFFEFFCVFALLFGFEQTRSALAAFSSAYRLSFCCGFRYQMTGFGLISWSNAPVIRK
tara:strand:+ start:28194 stop:28505 length:312 start_codon:yes stop_codon:yes gene_type:complete